MWALTGWDVVKLMAYALFMVAMLGRPHRSWPACAVIAVLIFGVGYAVLVANRNLDEIRTPHGAAGRE